MTLQLQLHRIPAIRLHAFKLNYMPSFLFWRSHVLDCLLASRDLMRKYHYLQPTLSPQEYVLVSDDEEIK